MQPEVSIICCVRNGAPHLTRFYDSLAGVADERLEILLVDDASTDATGSILDDWTNRVVGARVLHRTRSSGIGHAQSDAVRHARGEYLWLVDCDDVFPTDAVSTLLDAARAASADVVVGRAMSVDGAGVEHRPIDARRGAATLTGPEALEQMLDGDIEGYTWTKLYRRTLFDDEAFDDGGAAPPLTTQNDFCLTATAIARSERVVVLDRLVYTYVRHGASTMDRRDPPLENMAIARDHMVRLARAHLVQDAALRRRIARFTVWFLAASMIQVPFYVRARRSTWREGRRIARRAMRSVRVADVLSIDRTLGMEALLLRLDPLVYRLVFSLTHRPTARRDVPRLARPALPTIDDACIDGA